MAVKIFSLEVIIETEDPVLEEKYSRIQEFLEELIYDGVSEKEDELQLLIGDTELVEVMIE